MEPLIPLHRLPPAILGDDGEVYVIETELEASEEEASEEEASEEEASEEEAETYLNSPEYEEYCREAVEDEEMTRRASLYW